MDERTDRPTHVPFFCEKQEFRQWRLLTANPLLPLTNLYFLQWGKVKIIESRYSELYGGIFQNDYQIINKQSRRKEILTKKTSSWPTSYIALLRWAVSASFKTKSNDWLRISRWVFVEYISIINVSRHLHHHRHRHHGSLWHLRCVKKNLGLHLSVGNSREAYK